MTRKIDLISIRFSTAIIVSFIICQVSALAVWDCMWWDDFDQYDGTYVFNDYYNRVPTGTYWHVTEKTSAFTRRMSRDCSLWYGSETKGTYAGDVADCAALVTDPFNAGGISGGDDREVAVVFWQWIETENLYGRDICSVYTDRNDGNWTCLYRNYRITPGWKFQVCESFVVPAAATIRIKFEFNSNGDIRNDFGGWFIDELYVMTQAVGSRSGEKSERIDAFKASLPKGIRPGPQVLLNAGVSKVDKATEPDQSLDNLDQVPALSWVGILALMGAIGMIIGKNNKKSSLMIVFLLWNCIQLAEAYPSFQTMRITESDHLYDGKPDIAASANWGLTVWEKEIRNTTKLVFSTWAQEGDTWSDEQILETGNLNALRNPDVARDQDNANLFWIAFEGEDANGKRNVYAGRFDFNAETWTYSIVNGTSYDAAVSPAINGDTSNKRVAFTGLLNGTAKIYSSEWNGSAWASNIQVNEAAHLKCSEPSVSGAAIVYSAENSSGYREIYYKTRHPSGGWWGLVTVSTPVDSIPEIHPVIKSYPGSPSRIFIAWIRENQGDGDQVMFRDSINGTWGTTVSLSPDSLHTFFDMAYESQNQCLILLTERKSYDDWMNHKLHYYRRDYRTPTPSFGSGSEIIYGGLFHKMDLSLCDFRDGYSLAVWSGSPRESSQTDLSDRSIVFDTISESTTSLTPAPTNTPIYPTATPTHPPSSLVDSCACEPWYLNEYIDNPSSSSGSNILYGKAHPPFMFYATGEAPMIIRTFVIHSWDDILENTGCRYLSTNERAWFSFDPVTAIQHNCTHPIQISDKYWFGDFPGTATPTPTPEDTHPPGWPTSPPPTPRPTSTAAPNPSLEPYVTIAPWQISPTRNGVMMVRVETPPGCSGAPGNLTIQFPEYSSEIVVAESTDWEWDSVAEVWIFLWDGLFTDNQGRRVSPPEGYCFIRVNIGTGWGYFWPYRTSITIE